MRSENPKLAGLAGIATLASLIACYGTLAPVAMLSALGISGPITDVLRRHL